MTATWRIHLRKQFARRIEDDSLVLWRPGVTVWLAAWGNDHNQSQVERLARFSYRLQEENADGPVESLNACVIGDDDLLQVSVYFDDGADAAEAQELVDSVTLRQQA